ncbi:hypothetical protein H0H93_013560, partial [Arthromyces matolae]
SRSEKPSTDASIEAEKTSTRPSELQPESQAQQVAEPEPQLQPPEPAVPIPTPPTSPSPPLTTLNPIESTLSSHRSVWASFFSSRSLLMKRITAPEDATNTAAVERDENGIEVMDIPDDLDGGGGAEGEGSIQIQGDPIRGRDLTIKASSKIEPSKASHSHPRSVAGTNEAGGPRPSLINIRSTSSSTPVSRSTTPFPSTALPPPPPPVQPPSLNKPKAPPLIIADSIKFTSSSTATTSKPSSRSSSPKKPPQAPAAPGASPSPTPSIKSSKSEPVPSSSIFTKPGSTTSTTTLPPGSTPTTTRPSQPNLILPTWSDTFHTLPRSRPPDAGTHEEGTLVSKTMRFVSGVLFAGDATDGAGSASTTTTTTTGGAGAGAGADKDKDKERERERRKRELEQRYKHFGSELPRAYDILHPQAHLGRDRSPPTQTANQPPPPSSGWNLSTLGFGSKSKGKQKASASSSSQGVVDPTVEDVLRGCKRVVVIGVHGWFPGAIMRSVIGEAGSSKPSSSSLHVWARAPELEDWDEKLPQRRALRLPTHPATLF